MLTTSDLTVGLKIDIDEAIYMLSALDSPLINGLDADGAVILGSTPVSEIEYSWLDEELLTPRAQLDGAVTTGDTFITLDSNDDRLRFSTGDILMVEKAGSVEKIRVTGYATTAATLDVTRAFAGTTATNYADNAVVVGLGTALAEGSDPEDARARDRDSDSNFTQIFGPTAIHLSGTEQVVAKYGVPNEFAKQVFNRGKENVISRERAYLYGTKFNSTTTKIRTTGGFDHYITTNNDATSTELTVTAIESMQSLGYDQGGIGDLLTANPKSLGDLNALDDSNRVRVDIADPRRGRRRVMVVHTEFGDVTIVRNRYCRKSDAFLWTRDQVVRRPLRPMTLEKLAKTGDSDKVQILCEEGLQVKGQEHMGKFTALAY
jgi:hypothetical protein